MTLVMGLTAMLIGSSAMAKVLAENSECRITQEEGYEQKVSLRIEHLPSKKWALVQFPKEHLPLKEGIETEFQATFAKSDQATLSYRDGVLRYVAKLRTNLTHDEIELTASPTLETIEKVTYTRSGLGFAWLLTDGESFSCRF